MRVLALALSIIALVALSCSAYAVPSAPVITWPANGAVCGSDRPEIRWTGDAHTHFEVHISSHNVVSSPDQWDSGAVPGNGDRVLSGPLNAGLPPDPDKAYFVFVRLCDATGWGPWSAPGRHFYTAGRLMNEPYYVGDPIGGQWPHTMCYNPDLNQYLVAFPDAKPGQKKTVSYHLLNGSGERIIENSLSHTMLGIHAAGVAYGSKHQEYLIAYCGWTSESWCELWVQRVNALNGKPVLGSSVRMGEAVQLHDHTLPLDASYSPTSDVYCVVWHQLDWPGIHKAYGARVNGETGDVLNIADLGSDQANPCENPGVIYNPDNDEFFIIYGVNSYIVPPLTCRDYYARRMRASTGELIGGSILIANAPECEEQGGVSYDADLDRYLVVYQRFYGDKSIWGQFVSADGRLLNPDGTQQPAPDPFVIVDQASTGLICWSPQAAWDPVTKEFLVCFCDMDLSSNYGRRLSQNGLPVGTAFNITGSVTYNGNWLPTPLWNPVSGEFVFAWYNDYNDVWTRRYKSHSVPVPDTTAPGPVTGLTATPGDQQVTLSWTNPSDSDFAGVMIRYSLSGYPNGPGEGQLLASVPGAPGSAEAFTHQNLSGGVPYYYSVFAYDEVPNHAAAAKAGATPAGPRVFVTNAFTNGAEGWSTSVWKSGPYDLGTMAWSSSAGRSGGGMRCTGAGATDNDSRETREGGEMWKTISTVHYQNIRVSYDLRVSSLGSAWYGSGSGDPGAQVDHNDVQEQLTVSYSTNGGASWTEIAPWVGRDTLTGYLSYGTRQIDLSAIPGVGNNPNFALKLRWQLNQATDVADLDNIIISGSQMESISPSIAVTSPTSAAHCPANVTPFAVSGTASDNVGVTQVTWSSNRGGSGSCAVNPPGERSVYWDGTVSLQPGQNMLTFTARDEAGNARSDTLMIVYSPGPSASVGEARALANDSLVYLSSMQVTAVFGDCFYVEEADRSAGIKVKPYSTLSDVAIGKIVDVCGYLKTDTSGERYINGSALVVGGAGSP